MNARACYETLGLKPGASNYDIRKAYLDKARKCHPDKNPDCKLKAEEEFKRVSEAYDALINGRFKSENVNFSYSAAATFGANNFNSQESANYPKNANKIFEEFLHTSYTDNIFQHNIFEDDFFRRFFNDYQNSVNNFERMMNDIRNRCFVDATEGDEEYDNFFNEDDDKVSFQQVKVREALVNHRNKKLPDRKSVLIDIPITKEQKPNPPQNLNAQKPIGSTVLKNSNFLNLLNKSANSPASTPVLKSPKSPTASTQFPNLIKKPAAAGPKVMPKPINPTLLQKQNGPTFIQTPNGPTFIQTPNGPKLLAKTAVPLNNGIKVNQYK